MKEHKKLQAPKKILESQSPKEIPPTSQAPVGLPSMTNNSKNANKETPKNHHS